MRTILSLLAFHLTTAQVLSIIMGTMQGNKMLNVYGYMVMVRNQTHVIGNGILLDEGWALLMSQGHPFGNVRVTNVFRRSEYNAVSLQEMTVNVNQTGQSPENNFVLAELRRIDQGHQRYPPIYACMTGKEFLPRSNCRLVALNVDRNEGFIELFSLDATEFNRALCERALELAGRITGLAPPSLSQWETCYVSKNNPFRKYYASYGTVDAIDIGGALVCESNNVHYPVGLISRSFSLSIRFPFMPTIVHHFHSDLVRSVLHRSRYRASFCSGSHSLLGSQSPP